MSQRDAETRGVGGMQGVAGRNEPSMTRPRRVTGEAQPRADGQACSPMAPQAPAPGVTLWIDVRGDRSAGSRFVVRGSVEGRELAEQGEAQRHQQTPAPATWTVRASCFDSGGCFDRARGIRRVGRIGGTRTTPAPRRRRTNAGAYNSRTTPLPAARAGVDHACVLPCSLREQGYRSAARRPLGSPMGMKCRALGRR
jgi:hypothetical protein